MNPLQKINWIKDQYNIYKLDIHTIAKISGLTPREVADIITTTHHNYSNSQLQSYLQQAYENYGTLTKEKYDEWARKNDKPNSEIITNRFIKFEYALKTLDTRPCKTYSEINTQWIEHNNNIKPKTIMHRQLSQILTHLYPSCTIIQSKSWPWLKINGEYQTVDYYIPELQTIIECMNYDEFAMSHGVMSQDILNTQLSHEKMKICTENGYRFHLVDENITTAELYNVMHTVYIKQNTHIEEYGVPYNHRPGDVGYDLYASHDMTIMPGQHLNVGTEVYIDMPYDVYASILLRSSMAKNKLLTHQSLLDPGFRGEYKLQLWNFGDKAVNIEKGERTAQILFNYKVFISIVPIHELATSQRNTGCFGSTGKK